MQQRRFFLWVFGFFYAFLAGFNVLFMIRTLYLLFLITHFDMLLFCQNG
jgi:hypothetical protein